LYINIKKTVQRVSKDISRILYNMNQDYDIEETQLKQNELLDKFHSEKRHFWEGVENDMKSFKKNQSMERIHQLRMKYPFLKKKIRKNMKISTIMKTNILLKDFFTILQRKQNPPFTTDEETELYQYAISKVRGIFKHAQALKTGYCNSVIMSGYNTPRSLGGPILTFAITKDTLEGNEQWTERMCNDLDRSFPKVHLSQKIMMISSEKNTLNGRATHCKNGLEALHKLTVKNDFMAVFMCSNSIRIQDVFELSERLNYVNDAFQKRIQIIQDEAHNKTEGLPVHRETIEALLMLPNVYQYIPCTATQCTLYDDSNPIWNQNNIDANCMNYTEFDDTLSTDDTYSSCQDSNMISFETLKRNPRWIDRGIRKMPKDMFANVYSNELKKIDTFTVDKLKREYEKHLRLYQKYTCTIESYFLETMKMIHDKTKEQLVYNLKKLIIARKRCLEFVPLLQNEIKSINNGMNVLRLNEILETEYFIPNKFNLHIISTPCRKIITHYLAKQALQQSYDPIVLAIYGNQGDKYHLMCKEYDVKESIDTYMGKGEFNQKLERLIKWLHGAQGIRLNRPFIILGNYIPTGESLSFVNTAYGTIRGNIRLASTTREEDYQQACRSNYMLTRFTEKDSNFKPPEKYLIGEQQYLDNAIYYEQENDKRISELKERSGESNVNLSVTIRTYKDNTSNGTVSIPAKFVIDADEEDDDYNDVVQFKQLFAKSRKDPDTKLEIIKTMKRMLKNKVATLWDPQGKLSFDTYSLNQVRTYRKTSDPSTYRFKNYNDHYESNTPYMNDPIHHQKNEFELLGCVHTWKIKNKGEVYKNNTRTFWIGYKYE
jgi:hypothetical protein